MLPEAPDSWTLQEAAHLLNRAGFGGSPAAIAAMHVRGRKGAVEWLLQAEEPIDALAAPEWARSGQELLAKTETEMREIRRELRGLSDEERDKKRRMLNRDRQREQRRHGLELQSWWFGRMVGSEAQLREKMTLFWHDHFPSSMQKVRQAYFLYRQNSLFRKHALGNFRSLTHKIAKDPAMMLYLDTQSSKKGKPNENFAREVMELFTLGEGHYTEEDIKEAARAFTGYNLNRLTGKVSHVKRQWDDGDKTVLGQTGPFDGPGVIEILFAQEQCARYLPGKLWEFFAYEQPDKELIDALAETFAKGGFEVAPVLREIFLSKEFYSTRAMRTQIKSPVQFLVQMLRQLELEELPRAYVISIGQQLGQVLFQPPSVAGWDWGKAWINTNTLLTRYNVAGFITKGTDAESLASAGGGKAGDPKAGNAIRRAMSGIGKSWEGPDYEKVVPRGLREDSGELVRQLSFRLFQTQLEDRQLTAFRQFADAKRGVTFTNSEIAELVHLMMSTPHYQLT